MFDPILISLGGSPLAELVLGKNQAGDTSAQLVLVNESGQFYAIATTERAKASGVGTQIQDSENDRSE